MRRQPYFLICTAALPFASTLGCHQSRCRARLWRALSSSRTHAQAHKFRLLAAAAQHRQLFSSSTSSSSSSSSRSYPASAPLIQQSENITNPAMSDDSNSIVSTMPVPWARLKAWIEEQERAEQQGYNPNQMTKTQIAALSHIVDFIDEPEPDVSDRDYVSFLMQLTQTRKIPAPQYKDLEPIEVPIDGVFLLRWRTVCFVPSANLREFPCVGHGLHEGKYPPLFKSKKMSKQYAAKHAWQYLKSQPLSKTSLASASLLANGGTPLRPTFSPSAGNPAPSGSNSASVESFASTTPQGPTGGVPIVPPSPSPSPSDPMATENTEYYDNPKLPSLLEQVAIETNRVGFGCPKYDIGPDPEQPNCFAGRPVFKNGGRIPQDMGYVKGAISKGLAKELIAEEVLKYCELELKRRHGLIQTWGSAKDSIMEG